MLAQELGECLCPALPPTQSGLKAVLRMMDRHKHRSSVMSHKRLYISSFRFILWTVCQRQLL